jgi:hypothetical protein
VTHLLRFLVLPVALTVAACAVRPLVESAAPPPPPLDVEISSQMTARAALPWAAARPLVWADFRGTAPSGGTEGAQTAYGLFYGLRCSRDVFQFQVTTGFLPGESWVKPSVLASADESRRTLAHEQTHFDLSEVYARRMRRYFADLFRPCDQPLDRWRAVAEKFVDDESSAQDRYDDETRNGLIPERQRTWTADVAEQLRALGQFEN